MEICRHEVKFFECDLYGQAKPSLFVNLAVYGPMIKGNAECMGADKLFETHGIVRMLARVRLEQTAVVRETETLTVSVSTRSIDKGAYVRRVDFHRDSEAVGFACAYFMAVDVKERKILRPQTLETLWPHAEPPIELEGFRKLRPPKAGFETIGNSAVRWDDCDKNGHMTSAEYANVVCENSGFWENGPKLMERLQIDYSKECPPRSTLALSEAADGEECYMRGEHENGEISFTACYKFQ